MRQVIFACVFAFCACLFAQGEPAVFLRMGVGARAISMGECGVTDCDAPYAAFYNPAAVSEHGNVEFSAGNRFLDLDRRQFYGAIAAEISEGAGIGLTWTHAGVSNVEMRDNAGNHVGTVNNGSDAIHFAFAKQLVKKLHAGIGVEYLQSSIEGMASTTVGFGAGLIYKLREPNLTFGASVQNLLMEYSWNSNELLGTGTLSDEKIPLGYRAGVSYATKIGQTLINGCTEIEGYDGSDPKFHIGVQCAPLEQIAIRAGYDGESVTLGAGVRTKVGKFAIVGIDYAFKPEKLGLAPQHLIDLTLEY